MKKWVASITVVGLLLLSVTGCSIKTAPADGLDFTVEKADWNHGGFESNQGFPRAQIIDSQSFYWLDGGSSSCPNIIGNIVYNKVSDTVVIKYEPLHSEVCTDDFGLRSSKVVLNTPILTSQTVFEVETREGGETFPVYMVKTQDPV